MSLLIGNEVGVTVVLGLARKVLDLGDSFGRYFLVVETTGFFSCGVFFP